MLNTHECLSPHTDYSIDIMPHYETDDHHVLHYHGPSSY